jgi:nucleoside-diphosphate-sugar epimerase
MKFMNILVTGATGFIGKNLCNHLVQDERFEIYALVQKDSPSHLLDPKILQIISNNSASFFITILEQYKITGIIHLASLCLASHITEDIPQLLASNVTLGTNLLEAAVKTQVKWFINTSSFWQNYNNRPYSPVSLYAATKQAFEDILQYYLESTSLRGVTIVLPDTYGSNDSRPKLFNFLKQALVDKKEMAMSPGHQKLNLVYIKDVINGYQMLVEQLVAPQKKLAPKYCLFHPRSMTLRSIVAIFTKIYAQELPVKWGGRAYRQREIMRPRALYPLIPGWKPKYTLEKGLKEMLSIEKSNPR